MKSNPVLIGSAAIIVTAALALCCLAFAESGPEQPQDEPVALVLDTGDAQMMHAYGLPTESDVLHWHVFGEWGYKDCDDNIRMFAQLPGETWRWDNLYDIKWRKAFQY